MRLGLSIIFCLSVWTISAAAQPATSVTETAETKDAIIARKNAWTVGLISGQLEGVYPRFAAEMKKVLDDGDELRVMPILAYGAASNIEDLLYTKGIDIALTQSDVLQYFKSVRKIPNIAERIHYITSLYSTEFHLLARPEIKTIQDLAGKNVILGPMGNSASLTGSIVFNRLNIKINEQFFDHTTALEKLKSGEAAAVVRVIGKPAGDAFSSIPKDSGIHFLKISYDQSSNRIFDDIYSLGELTHQDYPNIIPQGEVVDTISVTTVLAVYNWPKDTDRLRRVERFTKYFFERFDRFLAAGFHPKWKEVNLAAPVPGWTRSRFAEQMLKEVMQADAKKDPRDTALMLAEFRSFLQNRGQGGVQGSDADALFKEFLSWRERGASR